MNHIGAPSPSLTPFSQFPDTIARAAVPSRGATRNKAETPAWHRAAGRRRGPASSATRRRWPTEATAGTAGAAPAGAPRPAWLGLPLCAPDTGNAGAEGRAGQRGPRGAGPAGWGAGRGDAGPDRSAARAGAGAGRVQGAAPSLPGGDRAKRGQDPMQRGAVGQIGGDVRGQMAGTGPAMTERKGASDSRVRVWMARLVRWAWAARQTRPARWAGATRRDRPARWAWAARQGQAGWRANVAPVRHNPMQREAGSAVAEVASSTGVAVR